MECIKSVENFNEDVDIDDFNVRQYYKQHQDSIEEKEQEFIQHVRTLSILSNNPSSSKQTGRIISNEPPTPRSKGIQLVDEFLDLRKLRRQFVTALYNHIEAYGKKIKTYQTNIKSLTQHQVEHDFKQSSHYQDILKSLDSKEKELIRMRHHQERMIEQARLETTNECSLKYKDDLEQLTIHYESQLRLLESKLASIETVNQSQKLQTVFDLQRRTSQANDEKTVQWQEKEKMYIDKLQKYAYLYQLNCIILTSF